MSTPLLLAATETRWLGAARFPKAAADAGWDVSLLAPPGSLVGKSRFVSRTGHLPERASPAQWVYAMAAMVTAVSPRVIVPCDDMTFRLLATLAEQRPGELQPALHERLRELIGFSLGDPAHYAVSVDKLRLPALARDLGVRFAESIVAESIDAAKRFAATHGWPVVLKRSISTGGLGVAICDGIAALETEFARLSRPELGAVPPFTEGVLVQRGLAGVRVFHPAVAWQGRLLAGWCAEVLDATPRPRAPPACAASTTIRRCASRSSDSSPGWA